MSGNWTPVVGTRIQARRWTVDTNTDMDTNTNTNTKTDTNTDNDTNTDTG